MTFCFNVHISRVPFLRLCDGLLGQETNLVIHSNSFWCGLHHCRTDFKWRWTCRFILKQLFNFSLALIWILVYFFRSSTIHVFDWEVWSIGIICYCFCKFTMFHFRIILIKLKYLQVYTAELFPTTIRNTAIGSCSTVARIGAISALLIGLLGGSTPMLILGISAIVGGFLALLFPETVGTKVGNILFIMDEM